MSYKDTIKLTKDQQRHVRKNYKTTTYAQMAREFNISVDSLKWQIRLMGLKKITIPERVEFSSREGIFDWATFRTSDELVFGAPERKRD